MTDITDLDDVETINYSNDTNMNDLNDLYKTDFKNNSGSQMLKKVIKKSRNSARKKLYKRPSPRDDNYYDLADLETIDYNNDSDLNDIDSNKKISSSQIPAKKILQKYKKLSKKKKHEPAVSFIKQVPVHPRQILKRKIKLENLNNISKKVKMMMSLS